LQTPELFETFTTWRDRLTPQPAARFDGVNGRRRLQALFGVDSLDAFGAFEPAEIAAAGALVDYVDLTQKGRLPRIAGRERLAAGSVMRSTPPPGATWS
jgi:DNA mismatch repair protein MutS